MRDQVFPLTLMEANLLRYLIQHEGKPVSRKAMLEEVWGLHEDTDTRAIDNFIVRLRRYIEDDPTQAAASADRARRRLPLRGRTGGRTVMRRIAGRARRRGGGGMVGRLRRARRTTSISYCSATAPEKRSPVSMSASGRNWPPRSRPSCCPPATPFRAWTTPRPKPSGSEVRRLLEPYRRIPLYLAPGNHDIWSDASERLFRQYAEHPPHYSFDSGGAHFAVLDNSRSDAWPAGELAWLESDLREHPPAPVKFVVSHRPSWLLDAALGNTNGPMHVLAKRYGVCCVIAGHVHQLIHADLDGVTYLALPSAGGHLRLSGKYEDGWFFGWTGVELRGREVVFQVHALDGATTPLSAWGRAGLISEPGLGLPHGMGIGDINGDGKMDIVNSRRWWEQPASGPGEGLWKFHAANFGSGGAEMGIYDVNGDGLNDVVTAIAAHTWGLAWFEQKRDAQGNITFVRPNIMGDFSTKNAGGVTFSEPHGLAFADMDGDGIPDMIVEKRPYSHLESHLDPDAYGPAVLYRYRTVRNPKAEGGAEFVPELIHNRSGVGSQFLVKDLNGDGAPDIVVSNVKGTFISWNQMHARKASR